MDLLEAKCLACISLGLGTTLVGLLPICFTNHGRQQWPLFLSCLLCFGGGVLLSTSLIHMLPEVRESLKSYEEHAELIFCIGFFILHIIDVIVHSFYGGNQEDLLNKGNDNSRYKQYGLEERRHSYYQKDSYGATEHTRLQKERQLPYNPSFYRTRSDSVLFTDDKTSSQLCHVGNKAPCPTTSPAMNIGLVVALTLHSILEGLVVGLEDQSSKVILLLAAIASHKLVVGFCLGVELSSNSRNSVCKHVVSILIFALGSVAGICIGIIVSALSIEFPSLVIPILQGLAGGTLLYVTVSEVLPRERAKWHQQHIRQGAGLYQFIAVAGGFTLMTLLTKYIGRD